MGSNIGKDIAMAEKIIRKKRRGFKRLHREEAMEVVTAMDRPGKGRTIGTVREVARKAGCSAATCYRLYKESFAEAIGPSVCVKTLYSYSRKGLLEGIRPVDLPRRKAFKT